MNLVQLNERLKDLPLQVIQQYANGMNPEVPPYLALGELQRRELSAKQMANQGGTSSPQPSIKEQVEQKAGLMELQKMQQMQMAQQQMQPRGPMPAPAEVPQPESQPEIAMARGGLANVPVRRSMFEYAGGGIVAFAAGGPSISDRLSDPAVRQMLEKLRKAGVPEDRIAQVIAQQIGTPESDEEYRKNEAARVDDGLPSRSSAIPVESIDPAVINLIKQSKVSETYPDFKGSVADKVRPPVSDVYPEPRGSAADKAVPMPPPPPTNRSLQPPAKLPPAPINRGLPAAAGAVNPYIGKLEALINKEPVKPTEQGALESVKKLTPEAMGEEAMKKRFADQRTRAEQERDLYEKSKPSGLDDLIRVFGQAGQYKGLSGLAPAYTAMQRQKRVEDMAMQERQNKLLTEVEGREYESAKNIFGENAKAFDRAQELFGQQATARVKGMADLAQVTQSQINSELDRLSDQEMKRLDRLSRAEDRNVQGAANRLKERYVVLKAQARQLKAQGKEKEATELESQAADILALSSGTANVGAARNRIMERRATMSELDKIIKNEGLTYTEEEVAEAAAQYKRLALENAKDEGGQGAGGNGPKIGEVQQGYRFKGGDPANSSNWEKVK